MKHNSTIRGIRFIDTYVTRRLLQQSIINLLESQTLKYSCKLENFDNIYNLQIRYSFFLSSSRESGINLSKCRNVHKYNRNGEYYLKIIIIINKAITIEWGMDGLLLRIMRLTKRFMRITGHCNSHRRSQCRFDVHTFVIASTFHEPYRSLLRNLADFKVHAAGNIDIFT